MMFEGVLVIVVVVAVTVIALVIGVVDAPYEYKSNTTLIFRSYLSLSSGENSSKKCQRRMNPMS